MDLYEHLAARGFIADCTDEAAVRELFSKERVTAYIGFDPTADSLHAGSLVQLMALAWMQRAGHRVIALVGGGTAMVGDPSGKTELRKMLSTEQLELNKAGISAQIRRFIELDGDKGVMVDNAEWLLGLNYIGFLREVGRHFSVNRMLAAESYKIRLEKGLSFIEFNYQILQAYDFLELFRRHGCRVQMGGSDQWGNIVAGIDLVRRLGPGEVYGLTSPLVMTASGEKMGKTAAGAVWLDAERLSAFDYFQYWRNVTDDDVGRFLRLFTFLPLAEIEALEALEGAAINQAKEKLAYEATRIVHGEQAAEQALAGARAAFAGGGSVDEIPTHTASLPCPVVDLLVDCGLCASKGDARRQIKGGAVKLGDGKAKVSDMNLVIGPEHLDAEGSVALWKGKKSTVRIVAG
jgi:tyrosyl-tRNA synthetase